MRAETVPDPYPVGMALKPRQLLVDKDAINRYLLSVRADPDGYLAPSRWGPASMPVGMLSFEPAAFPDFPGYPEQRQIFNCKSEWAYHRRVDAGSSLTLRWEVSDRWLKRGRDYVTFHMPCFDELGNLVAEGWFTEAFSDPPEFFPPLPERDGEASALKVTRPGPELGRMSRVFTVEMARGVVWQETNWHNDAEMARAMGFPGVVLVGAQIQNLLTELLTRMFGLGFLEGGRVGVNYLRPTYVGERIVARVCEHDLTQDPDGVTRHHLAVSCVDEDGKPVCAGIASARATEDMVRVFEQVGVTRP